MRVGAITEYKPDMDGTLDQDQLERSTHKAIQHARKQDKLNKAEGIEQKNAIPSSVKRIPAVPKEQEWEIEAITDQQKSNDRKMLYCIHWEGYGKEEDTWQSYKDVKSTAAYAKWILAKKK